jgi:hypothetical protein
MLAIREAALRVANCRFVNETATPGATIAVVKSAFCEMRNCLAAHKHDGESFLSWNYPSSGRLVLDNNLLVDNRQAPSKWSRALVFVPMPNSPPKAADAEELVKRLVAWHEQRNAYVVGKLHFLDIALGEKDNIWKCKNVEEWEEFWGIRESGSLEGLVQFEGGDLAKKAMNSPATLVPADFRLAEGSIGKGARADGKDLGADVDLVGPDPAYEKWKQTDAYKQWLRDTGQER